MKHICMTSAAILHAFTNFKGVRCTINSWFHKNEKKILCILLAILAVIIGNRVSLTNFLEIQASAEKSSIQEVQNDSPIYEVSIDPIKEEAEYVAKVLYGTAYENSLKGKELTVWCIINRVESSLYPNTVKEVCRQKNQWMGYSDSNPIMQDLYNIAYDILSGWHNGAYRTISPDYIFLSWSSKSIVLRTEFEDSKTCRYLYE